MDIDEIKKRDLREYLATFGLKPIRETSFNYVYYSPFRAEKVPSFLVRKSKNRWIDFGNEKGGTIIDFVMESKNVGFSEAVNILKRGSIFSLPEYEKPTNPPTKGIEIVSVNELHSDNLLAYLEKRCIPLSLARLYLKQIEFRFPHGKRPGRIYSAIGFKNDSGGYELRSSFFKVSNSPKMITTIHGDESRYYVFEGFMDFLSALVYFKKEKLKFTTIVLNSLGFITTLIPILKEAETNLLFIDYGKAADEKIAILRKEGVPLEDCRYHFAGYGDFNEFLVANSL